MLSSTQQIQRLTGSWRSSLSFTRKTLTAVWKCLLRFHKAKNIGFIYILHCHYHDIYHPSYISLKWTFNDIKTKYKWGRVIKRVILGASAPAKRHDVQEKPRLNLPFLFMFLLCFCFLSFIDCLFSSSSNFLIRGQWGFAVLQDALAVRIWSKSSSCDSMEKGSGDAWRQRTAGSHPLRRLTMDHNMRP